MLRNTTPEEVQQACLKNNITQVNHHTCGICQVMVMYIIEAGKLYFDAGCGCASTGMAERPWSDASDWINMQTRDDIKLTLGKMFGIDLSQQLDKPKTQKVKLPEFVCIDRELLDAYKGALYTISCMRPSFKNSTTASLNHDEAILCDAANIAESMYNRLKVILDSDGEFDWKPAIEKIGEGLDERLVYLRGHYPGSDAEPDIVIVGKYDRGGYTEGWVDTSGRVFYAVGYSMTPPIPACVSR